ncbi:MAG: hypothetical protein JWO38_8045 [Gemmataceae bacterium]|nr:hypothetical protein [Gemmataceae bacterium]
MLRTTNSQFRRVVRPGITLVELMVMAAVCLIIMAVLASVFQTGLDAMRQVRSAGEMMDQLRAAGEVMKRDLQAQHFSPEDGKPNQGVGLSDQWFNQAGWKAPQGGFFKIVSPPPFVEGIDSDGLQSTIATNHILHFTEVRPGGNYHNLYAATTSSGGLTSPSAEVAYFLISDSGRMTAPDSTGSSPQQLFLLVRRQRLVATLATDKASWPKDQDVICCWPGPNPPAAPAVYSMLDLKANVTGGRVGYAPLNTTTPINRVGDDILLTNVISFEIKPVWETTNATLAPRPFSALPSQIAPKGALDDPTLPGSTPGTKLYPNTTDGPYDNLNLIGGTFDTWSNPQIRVKGLHIRLRVYDPKMKAARQSTFVVSM